MNRVNKYINNNENSKYIMNKKTEDNNHINGNEYFSTELSSNNINRNKDDKYPNIIINNNYLYNYMPVVAMNNNSIRKNNDSKKQFKNTSIGNKNKNLYRDKRYLINIKKSLNNSQNIKADIPNTFLYSSLIENNSKININNKMINQENRNKINKKYKKLPNMKINIIDSYSENTYSNSNLFNYKPKFVSSNIIDKINNINKTNISEYNIFDNKGTSNNITECYISKEKNNKKPKQNPPLSKNPKKLNITSLIKQNNKKLKKNNSRHKHQIHSFVEINNYHKRYNRNVCETIDYILYPENYKIKNDIEVLDNFDDMNTIIKRINFEKVDLKSSNIFTLNDEENDKQDGMNLLYKRYSTNFNSLFEKKFFKVKNIQESQKENNHNIYHSKQSERIKDNNKEGLSEKKI
jgi:hypothetical protein